MFSLPELNDFRFAISHKATDPNEKINPASPCIFKVQSDKSAIKENEDFSTLTSPVNIYPNPFQYEAVLDITLNQSDKVNVSVFNLKGELIEIPVNNEYQAKGRHRFYINAYNWPQGVYFCKIDIGNKTYVQKIVKVN